MATGGPDEADDLIALAERGSLWARDSGGDTARAYDKDAATARLGRLRLELELDNALRTEQLALHYQPEFDLRTGQLLAVEALLRWEHPRLGLVRADAFVDDTERSRTFAEVQLWVVDRACAHLAGLACAPGRARPRPADQRVVLAAGPSRHRRAVARDHRRSRPRSRRRSAWS